ncbi:MAG: HAD-IIB family hydrolase, partial [Clostridia bacterium]|nr:HAD-IIB family hydrolase [Clostridia bacterium]
VGVVFRSEEERKEKERQFCMDGLSYTSAFPNGLEFTDKKAHKGSGIAALSEILGVSKDEVMAIGDGLNDVPMLSFAGVSVAMGNAVDEAKAVAKYITLDNDSDGAALAIRKFAFGER